MAYNRYWAVVSLCFITLFALIYGCCSSKHLVIWYIPYSILREALIITVNFLYIKRAAIFCSCISKSSTSRLLSLRRCISSLTYGYLMLYMHPGYFQSSRSLPKQISNLSVHCLHICQYLQIYACHSIDSFLGLSL